MNEKRIDRRITEEDIRTRGAKTTYRLDEAMHAIHEPLAHRESKEGYHLYVFGCDDESAIVIIIHSPWRGFLDHDEMARVYKRWNHLVTDYERTVWGSMDSHLGFVNVTFKLSDEKSSLELPPFNLSFSPNLHRETEVFRQHIYPKSYLDGYVPSSWSQ